jgi:hypothetical protein
MSVADDYRNRSSLFLLVGRAHHEAMTLSDCPICGRRELRGERSLRPFHTPRGDVLSIACRRCGSVLSASSNSVLDASPLPV